jgi:hypothetical protein
MAKKSASIEDTTLEEVVVVETPAVEKPWEGFQSRDFFTPIEGISNARLENSAEEVTDGGQEEA